MSVIDVQRSPDEALAAALAVLGSPTRLQLLRTLRTPKALGEIAIKVPDPNGAPRSLARQTIREHLNKLIEVGMVTTREVDRDYGDTVEFVANHQTLFALAEEVRDLSRVRPAVEPKAVTVHAPTSSREIRRGATLVVVKGLDEGMTFDIDANHGRTSWTVGRRRGLDVSLDYDPYISGRNTLVHWRDGAHHVEDVPESRNGTSVNFRPLRPGESVALSHGDIIGIGRCLLLYRT